MIKIKNKNNILVYLILFVLITQMKLSAQNNYIEAGYHWDKTYILTENNIQNINMDPGFWQFEARDRIHLQNGFRFTAINNGLINRKFEAKIGNKNKILEKYDYSSSKFDYDFDHNKSNNRLFNYDAATLKLNGSYSVSPTGAFIYQIPIDMPQGTNNVKPQLSIVYNSQSGNGLLGYGWNISGLSMISRIQNTKYYDGNTQELGLNNFDKFALDGQRLICDDYTQYGNNGTIYNTESTNFSQIKQYSSNGQIDNTYFVVNSKDGSTLYYGSGSANDNSVIRSNNSAKTILFWKLYKIVDKNGNYIIYNYSDAELNGGESWLESIEYSGNSNSVPAIQPFNKIEFLYKKREDINQVYIAGNSISNTALLERINIYSKNEYMKGYIFNYFLDHYSHLYKIDLDYSNGSNIEDYKINPMLIDWKESNESDFWFGNLQQAFPTSQNEQLSANGKNGFLFGDFCSHGQSDFISLDEEHNQWKIYKNNTTNGPVNYNKIVEGNLGMITRLNSWDYRYNIEYKNSFANDMNFDGKVDLVLCCERMDCVMEYVLDMDLQRIPVYDRNPDGTYKLDENGYKIYLYDLQDTSWVNSERYNYLVVLNNSTFNSTTQTLDVSLDFANAEFMDSELNPHIIRMGNFLDKYNLQIFALTENDYLGNILEFNEETSKLEITFNDFSTPFNYSLNFEEKIDNNCIQTLEFNGDGITEILINKNNEDGFSQLKVYKIVNNIIALNFNCIYSEDINTQNILPRNLKENIMIGDFNADGKSDILFNSAKYFINSNGNNGQEKIWKIYKSNGINFINANLSLEISNNTNLGYQFKAFLNDQGGIEYCKKISDRNNKDCIYQIGDFNGDGRSDILEITGRYGSQNIKILYSYGEGFRVEETSKNLFGENDAIEYLRASDPISLDINGDGNAEFLNFYNINVNNKNLKSMKCFYIHPFEETLNIESIVDGFNNQVDVKFKLLNKNSNYTNTHYNYGENFITLNNSSYLTSLISEFDENTKTKKTLSYYFKDAIANKFKGFLGFMESKIIENFSIQNENSSNDYILFKANIFESKNYLDLSIPILIPNIETTYKYICDEINSNLQDKISEKESQSDIKIFGSLTNHNRKYCLLNKNVETIDYINKRKNITLFDYENENDLSNFIGNISFSTQNFYKYLSGDLNEENNWELYFTKTNQLDYFNGSSLFMKSLVTHSGSTQYYVNSIDNDFVINEDFTYDSKGNLIEQVQNQTETNALKLTYLYNDIGLITSKSFIPINTNYSVSPTNEYYEYDKYGVNLTQVTYNNGTKSQTVYDTKFGLPIAKIDINGLIINTYYDLFGRVIKEVYPDSREVTYEYKFLNNSSSDYGFNTEPTEYKYINGYKALTKITKTEKTKPKNTTYFDSKGRDLRTISEINSNNKVCIDKFFSVKPTKSIVTDPYKVGNEIGNLSVEIYDDYDRLVEKRYQVGNSPNNDNDIYSFVEYAYDNVKTTDQDGKINYVYFDCLGTKIKTVDPQNNFMEFVYYNSGKIKENVAYNPNYVVLSRVKIEYDNRGNQTELIDVDAGKTIYEFDAYGQLRYQKDNKGIETFSTYDNNNRLISSKLSSYSTPTYYTYYDNPGEGFGKIKTITAHNNSSVTYTYDIFGRETSVTENTIDGNNIVSFTSSYQYKNFGTEKLVTYPSGLVVKYKNNSQNSLPEYINIGDGENNKIYEVGMIDEYGRVTNGKLANNIYQFYNSYDDYNRLSSKELKIGDNNLHSEFYTYFRNGNLRSRIDNYTRTESFDYDELDRLTMINGFNVVDYSNGGNITYKKFVGDYTYHPVKKHQVISINADIDNLNFLRNQSTTYAPNNKIESISEDKFSANFIYGPSDERRVMTITENSDLKVKRYYFVNYEKEILPHNVIREIHYINSPTGLAAIYIKETNQPDKIYYVQTDRQGSIIGLFQTDGTNVTQVAEASYDAWGNPRDPLTSCYYSDNIIDNPIYEITTRGYTGHEHLLDFGLINMNGRLYDPAIGRFLSPDNFVQSPDNIQNYNRYSYCLNNPLKYTDPSGQLFGIDDFLIAWGIGYLVNSISTNNWGIESVAKGFVSAWTAGVTGGLSEALFTKFPGAYAGFLIGGSTSVLNNGFSNIMDGKYFLDGAGTSFLLGGIAGGIKGGYNSYKNGGNVFTGGRVYGGRSIWDPFNPNDISEGNFYEYSTNEIEDSRYINIGSENYPEGQCFFNCQDDIYNDIYGSRLNEDEFLSIKHNNEISQSNEFLAQGDRFIQNHFPSNTVQKQYLKATITDLFSLIQNNNCDQLRMMLGSSSHEIIFQTLKVAKYDGSFILSILSNGFEKSYNNDNINDFFKLININYTIKEPNGFHAFIFR